MSITVSRQVRRTRETIEEMKPGDLFEFEADNSTSEIFILLDDPSAKATRLSASLFTGRTIRSNCEAIVFPIKGNLEWKYRDET